MGAKLREYGIGAVGGLLSSGILLTIYFVVTANAKGADGGDWLAFSGVIFGVIITIGGARAIDHVREGRRRRESIARMRTALGVWIRAINEFGANQNNAGINDLRQNYEYIGVLAADIDRDLVAATLGLHAFKFHVPQMLDRLHTIIFDMPPDAAQQVAMNHVLIDMRGYAQNVLRALADG